MYEDLKGKTALITGSGKRTGMGYAMAEALAGSGANVIIADLGRGEVIDDDLKMGAWEEMTRLAGELAERFGVKTLAVPVDVTDNASIGAMVASASKPLMSPLPGALTVSRVPRLLLFRLTAEKSI